MHQVYRCDVIDKNRISNMISRPNSFQVNASPRSLTLTLGQGSVLQVLRICVFGLEIPGQQQAKLFFCIGPFLSTPLCSLTSWSSDVKPELERIKQRNQLLKRFLFPWNFNSPFSSKMILVRPARVQMRAILRTKSCKKHDMRLRQSIYTLKVIVLYI
jgi:hypothetical protein